MNRVPEHVGAEVPFKVLEGYPFAAPDALRGLEVLECDNHAIHRHIRKADEDDDRGKHQQIQSPIALDLGPGAAFAQTAGLYHGILPFPISDCL